MRIFINSLMGVLSNSKLPKALSFKLYGIQRNKIDAYPYSNNIYLK
jgi:hypothetical protein